MRVAQVAKQPSALSIKVRFLVSAPISKPRHSPGFFRYEGSAMPKNTKLCPSLSQTTQQDVILKSANGKVEMNLTTGVFKLLRSFQFRLTS